MKPPVSVETPLRAAAITSASVTALACSRSGSTRTCNCRSRCPQIATLATPGTAISRGRIVQSAIVVMSICESVFDVMPILSARLSDDSGDSSTGARATAGRLAADPGQPLLDELTRLHQVRALSEDQHDRRQAEHRLRSDGRDLGHAGERALDRHADERLDLECRQPGRLGLHFNQRRRELGKTSNGTERMARAPATDGDDRQHADDDRVAQRQRDQPAQHRATCPRRTRCRRAPPRRRSRWSCPRSSPRTTITLVPAGPPSSTRRRAY